MPESQDAHPASTRSAPNLVILSSVGAKGSVEISLKETMMWSHLYPWNLKLSKGEGDVIKVM